MRRAKQASWWHAPASLLAAASTLWVASHASMEAVQMLGLILIVGTGFYFIAARSKPLVTAALT